MGHLTWDSSLCLPGHIISLLYSGKENPPSLSPSRGSYHPIPPSIHTAETDWLTNLPILSEIYQLSPVHSKLLLTSTPPGLGFVSTGRGPAIASFTHRVLLVLETGRVGTIRTAEQTVWTVPVAQDLREFQFEFSSSVSVIFSIVKN